MSAAGRIVRVVFGVLACAFVSFADDSDAARRPYEMVSAGRTQDAHAPLEALTDAANWRVGTEAAEARFVRATDRLLFGDGVCRLSYRATGANPIVDLAPGSPLPIATNCDAMSVWCYGNNIFGRDPTTPSTELSALFKTPSGRTVRIPFGRIVHKEWHLLHRRFPQDAVTALASGGTFTGFRLTGGTNTAFRSLDLNSFCVFREEMKPLAFAPPRAPDFPTWQLQSLGRDALRPVCGRDRARPSQTETEVLQLPPTSSDGFFPPAARRAAEDRLEFRLPANPTDWSDLAFRRGDGPWIALARGGGVFPASVARTAAVAFRRAGNAVVAEITAPAGNEFAEIKVGRTDSPAGARRVCFPYYTFAAPDARARPAVLALPGERPTFVSATFDWYASRAASLGFPAGETPEGLTADLWYFLKTDRRRNAIRERIVWAVGDDIESVLPVIANPPSPYRREVGTRAWATHGVTDAATRRAKDADYWRDVHRRGMTRLIVTDHEGMWRDGEESFTCRTNTAPAKGGNAAQAAYTRTMIDELGFLYGPYNNFVDLAPVNANWNVDLIARCAAGQNGRLQDAWRRCYKLKSARAPELCRHFSQAQQTLFGFTCGYCDVHTNHQPWRNTDYDARVPEAGMFARVYRDYAAVMAEQRRAWRGPVFSEGGCHWLYAGLNDGNYGRDDAWRFDRGENPWIVDFDLRRIHPLTVNFGVGNYWLFYPQERPREQTLDRAMDRIFAATLAFGHSPFFFGGAQEGKGRDIELRSYFLLQAICARTTQADVRTIAYVNAAGTLEPLEKAVFTGTVNRSQVYVRYADGTDVVVNGSRTEDLAWTRADGTRLVLPPDGFWAQSGDGKVRVWSGRMADGHRAEYVVSPEYVFINGRGQRTDFGPLGVSDRPLVTRCGCTRLHAFPSVPWTDLKIERTETAIRLVDSRGNRVASLHGEPYGVSLAKVSVSVGADGLSIDAGAAFRENFRKLLLTTAGVAPGELAGKTCTLKARVRGPAGSGFDLFFEGHGPKPIGHFYRKASACPRGRMRDYPLIAEVPAGLGELHIRFDITKQPAGQPILVQSFSWGTRADQPLATERKDVRPELLFKADFDGTAEASFAKGAAAPTEARALAFAPGVSGQAVRISRRDKSLLAYAVRDNLDLARGTVAMWVKREWDFAASQPWHMLFATPWAGGRGDTRIGSGALQFWFHGCQLRADLSDDNDRYRTCGIPADNRWVHIAFTWDETGARLYVDGKRRDGRSDSFSPMAAALKPPDLLMRAWEDFRTFTVGSCGTSYQADALIDDLRVYSAPLDTEALAALAREHTPAQPPPARPDYARLFAKDGPNPYETESVGAGGVPGEMDLVDEVRFDGGVTNRLGQGRFRSVGDFSFKALGATPYLELGGCAGSRVAIRFNIDTNAPLHCFEFDYPDDAKRTADLIVQPCWSGDYALQVGYAAGDEYPNSGKILTHRCVYWGRTPEVAAVLMTARAGAPAAVSAIRLYRIRKNALPVAKVNEPKPNAALWHRTVALYYEDPAIGGDFGLNAEFAGTARGVGALIDRTAALMKYTGENLFAYPGVWYHGLIGDDYDPRPHAPDFLKAWYEKFGKEGLGVIPTVNPNTMPVAEGLVTRETMSNGALHPTEIAIHDTGKPNWGRWHDTPPNFNFHHPKVQANIERLIDALLAEGRDYPAFKGICLHLTRHCLLWFGDEISGYNDYTVKAFAEETGTAVPLAKFAANPLRGADYAAWLRANAWEKWLQWRCDRVTEFYVRQAKKLAAARPDLKLWLNSFVPADVRHPEFTRPDYLPRANRRCGLDGAALTKGASNIILGQALVPADYRHRDAAAYPSPAARAHQRVLESLPGFYGLLGGADYPWVHQHDRYWESAIGRTGGSLSGGWMKECAWRVSTVNPAGRHALRHFVLPLRYHDVLGLSKGGFLIGTYGMEDVLVPFVRAFRALPAVVMDEIGRVGNVVIRQTDFDGKRYFYIVNTDLCDARMKLVFPAGTEDLVSGERLSGKMTLPLKAYELRAFSAPAGRLTLRQ